MEPLMFMMAGKAIFTVHNEETGGRLTYKVVKAKVDPGKPQIHFVSAMAGPSNEKYSYLGTIFSENKFVQTKKSKFPFESTEAKGFRWLFNLLIGKNDFPEKVKFHHEGRCGKCGKRLTVPESIESGFGPECSKMLGLV